MFEFEFLSILKQTPMSLICFLFCLFTFTSWVYVFFVFIFLFLPFSLFVSVHLSLLVFWLICNPANIYSCILSHCWSTFLYASLTDFLICFVSIFLAEYLDKTLLPHTRSVTLSLLYLDLCFSVFVPGFRCFSGHHTTATQSILISIRKSVAISLSLSLSLKQGR